MTEKDLLMMILDSSDDDCPFSTCWTSQAASADDEIDFRKVCKMK